MEKMRKTHTLSSEPNLTSLLATLHTLLNISTKQVAMIVTYRDTVNNKPSAQQLVHGRCS